MTDLGDLGSVVQGDSGGDGRGRHSKEHEIRALFSQSKILGKGVWKPKLPLLLFFSMTEGLFRVLRREEILHVFTII